MRQSTSRAQHQSANAPAADEVEVPGRGEILLRNYDQQWGYELELEMIKAAGDSVFEKQYYLPPGHVASELEAVPAGEYEVRATLDNQKDETMECAIDADPRQTLVIEVGNGVLSLTQGLHS